MTHPKDAPKPNHSEGGGELKPCPFCGVSLYIRGGVNPYGRCDTPGCWTQKRGVTIPLDDPSQVEQWNTRAPATPSPEYGELVMAARAVVLAAWTDRHSRLHGHATVEALDAVLRSLLNKEGK